MGYSTEGTSDTGLGSKVSEKSELHLTLKILLKIPENVRKEHPGITGTVPYPQSPKPQVFLQHQKRALSQAAVHVAGSVW